MQHRRPLQSQRMNRILRQFRLLFRLIGGIAPHVIAALGEVGMRVGKAELHQLAALVDRARSHRSRAGEIPQLDDDARIGNELLRDGDRLARIALAVLERVGQRPAVHAAGPVDLVQRQVQTTGAGRTDATLTSSRRRERAMRVPLVASQPCRFSSGLRLRSLPEPEGAIMHNQIDCARIFYAAGLGSSGTIGSPKVCISRLALANIATALDRSWISRSSIPTARSGVRSATVIAAGARVSLAA